MSMVLILAMITPDVHQRIVDTKGDYWAQMMEQKVESSFVAERDFFDDLDYRDLLPEVEEEGHLLYEIVQGEDLGNPLVDGYDWTYGVPKYFTPDEVKLIYKKLRQHEDDWPESEFVDFFRRAASENKGVIIGVA